MWGLLVFLTGACAFIALLAFGLTWIGREFSWQVLAVSIVLIIASITCWNVGTSVDKQNAFDNMNIEINYEIVISISEYTLETNSGTYRHSNIEYKNKEEINRKLFDMFGEVSYDGIVAGDLIEMTELKGNFYSWLLKVRVVESGGEN